MDPITLAVGGIGLGMKLFGAFSSSHDSQHMADLEKQQAGLEMQINNQRKQQMELNGRRSLLEIARTTQRMKAQGLQAGVNQGAQFGSSVQSAQAQITSQGNYNALGVSQNLEIGRNIFGLNDQISGVKMNMADVRSSLATDQGWSSLGGALMGSAGTISNLAGNSPFGTSAGGRAPGYSPSPLMRMFG